MLTTSYINPKSINTVSNETKQKISNTLRAKGPLSAETKRKMSDSKKGNKNFWYKKSLATKILDKAAELKGIKVYAYDAKSFQLVNGKPFRSLRETAKNLPINPGTLPNKMDTGKPFKGYFYFSSAHNFGA
jgi:group I intron endonuclease